MEEPVSYCMISNNGTVCYRMSLELPPAGGGGGLSSSFSALVFAPFLK